MPGGGKASRTSSLRAPTIQAPRFASGGVRGTRLPVLQACERSSRASAISLASLLPSMRTVPRAERPASEAARFPAARVSSSAARQGSASPVSPPGRSGRGRMRSGWRRVAVAARPATVSRVLGRGRLSLIFILLSKEPPISDTPCPYRERLVLRYAPQSAARPLLTVSNRLSESFPCFRASGTLPAAT